MVRFCYTVFVVEKTAFFYSKGKFICPGESYTFQIPAKENYQCIKPSEIIHFDRFLIEKLLTKIPKLEIIGRLATENELITCQKMVASFVCLSPEQRYIELLNQNGELFNEVPQHYIASYLGVSPETLSRIKRRPLS